MWGRDKDLEQAAMKPTLKRKRDEEEQAREDREDKPWASGSRAKAGGLGKGSTEAPRKKQRVEVVIPPQPKKDALQAAQKEEPEPDILLALVNINNSVASLVRAVMVSNIHLATIARYVEVLAGVGSDSDDSDDDEVVHGLEKVMVNTWLDQDW